jgi:hypothetical protein
MARMVPFPMLPTDSSAERRLYEGFLEQLGDEYVVYHSVDWVMSPRGGDAQGSPEQGEADFVIAHPEDGVLAVEAKGGTLRYEPDTRRWTQSGHSGPHPLQKDPFVQARSEIRSLMRILERQPGFERWRPSFGHGLAFPDGRYDAPAHPGAPAEIVIDRGDMDRLADRVRAVMAFWRRPDRVFGAEGMDALALALGYRVEVRTPLKLRFDEDDRKIVELTNEQAWVLAYVLHRRRAAVTGPAGCGKTLLAIDVARHLSEGGSRTLLTCFNTGLAEHLRASTDGVAGDLTVANFHTLCIDLAKEAGIAVPMFEPDGEPAFYQHTLPDLLERASRTLGPRFEAIVVDEAQDFRDWWWPALLSLHDDPDGGTLYLFADDHQNLYGGGALPVRADDVLPPLPANLRNSQQIHEFVTVHFDADARPDAKGPPGRPVEILDYRDGDDLAHLLEVVLTNLTEEEQLPLDDIVVLTPAGREKSLLWARRSFGRFRLDDTVSPGSVLWSSVHAFKGLERPVVILAELGERHDSDMETYVYVGGSRARHHLIVLATETTARELRRVARMRVAAP